MFNAAKTKTARPNRVRAAKVLRARGWSLKTAWEAVRSITEIEAFDHYPHPGDKLLDTSGEGEPVEIGFLLLALRQPHECTVFRR